MRIGLIGCGAWGKNLARNLHELGVLHALCDHNAAAMERQHALYPTTRCFADSSELIAADCLDAVVIASSAPTHFPIIDQAFAAGLDVYCEKPLTLALPEAEEAARRATAQGRVLMVGHLLQYHPVFRRLVELVRSGRLGTIRYLAAHRVNLGAFRFKESALWCLSPHDISMILRLLDDRLPEAVLALGGDYLTDGIQDLVHTHLRFSDGVRAHCYASWLNPYKEQRLTVIGSAATAVFDDVQSWERKLCLYPEPVRLDDSGLPIPNPGPGEPVAVAPGEPLKDEIRHFIDCCRERRAPDTGPAEALRVMRVCTAAQASVDGGGIWQSI